MLSNFLWPKDGRGPRDDGPTVLRPARAADVEPAVRLILSSTAGASGGSADEHHVQDFLVYVRTRGIDLDLLWVAEVNGRLIHAALPVVSPGRTMLIFSTRVPPRGAGKGAKANAPSGEGVLRRLVEKVCASAGSKDVHLAQSLLDPAEEGMRRVYAAAGFEVMAELHYMQTTVKTAPAPPLPPGCSWRTYSETTHDLFARAILQSYRDSLDCPSLNGLRDIDDIITGHRASGYFDPEQWFVLAESPAESPGELPGGVGPGAGNPLGVLLLSVSPKNDVVELVYLGLSPEARGRSVGSPPMKVGQILMQQALCAVAGAGLSRLALAVDSRNVPALKLYYRNGLQRIGAKLALMRDLRRSRAPGP